MTQTRLSRVHIHLSFHYTEYFKNGISSSWMMMMMMMMMIHDNSQYKKGSAISESIINQQGYLAATARIGFRSYILMSHTHTYIYIPERKVSKGTSRSSKWNSLSCDVLHIYIYCIYCIYNKHRRLRPINPKRHTFCQNQVTSISALLKEIQVPEPMPRCIAMPMANCFQGPTEEFDVIWKIAINWINPLVVINHG